MKAYSSKRAKACQIPQKVKAIVYERDNERCIVCGRRGFPDAHYVPRSKGGLGIEQNIVTLCRECHRKFDQGDGQTMDTFGEIIRNYLKSKYEDWDEKNLVFRKYEGVFDEDTT